MPQENTLRKRIPDVILDLFRDKFGGDQGTFRMFRVGDPIIIPESMMPAIIVLEPNTHYSFGPTGMDEIVHRLLLKVVFNKKDDFGNPNPNATLDQKIDDVVQGRDITTGDFLDNSILGVLRRNYTLGNLTVNMVEDVDKDVVQRSETLFTAEAHIRIEVTELQAIANRV